MAVEHGSHAPSRRLLLAVVTDESGTLDDTAAEALEHLAERAFAGYYLKNFADVLARSKRYLTKAAPDAAPELVVADSFGNLAAKLAADPDPRPATLTLLVIDHPDFRASAVAAANCIDEQLAKLASVLPDRVSFNPSPSTVQLHTDPPAGAHLGIGPFALRWPSSERWAAVADLICSFTDSVQVEQMSRLHLPTPPTTLATEIAAFLDDRAGSSWGLHYYTGSVVARTIDDLERHAAANGNPVLRGPSEHSLACAVHARWELDRAPGVIVVTSGMIDEFRGTLANLRSARAKGFILCADSRPEQWYPFQGTITGAEDSREVVRARGLPVVHLDHTSRIADGLAEAFAAYDTDAGPVVLFATKEVLDSANPVAVARTPPSETAGKSGSAGTSGTEVSAAVPGFEELVRLVNEKPVRLLCQPGPLGAEEAGALRALARAAGIGLADSLTHPGSISRYHEGERVPEFLGTMSLYGTSPRVYEFLHRDDRPRPADEQTLMFLNSRIEEIDTSLSARNLRRSHIVQATADPADHAPFTDLGVACPAAVLLPALLDRLEVDQEVLRMRRAAIESTRDSFSDVVGLIPTRPMSPNYFFRELHDVLDLLITERSYRYTGVYDVGRSGLSAVCNLPRTGPGFSGWAGRALMGDALQAVPAIALSRDDNVLAFIGDGAWAMVPDILPSLVQQIAAGGIAHRGNLTIFRCINGGHSIIRTYREGRRPSSVSSQTSVLSFVEDDWTRTVEGVTVGHRALSGVDRDELTSMLLEPASINVCSVYLAHNNEGDGLGLASLGWQRDNLSERGLALTSSTRADRARSARPAGTADWRHR
jgi:thiamine pyrophosphate-dependent acetolactate synthase large subunit-like protein